MGAREKESATLLTRLQADRSLDTAISGRPDLIVGRPAGGQALPITAIATTRCAGEKLNEAGSQKRQAGPGKWHNGVMNYKAGKRDDLSAVPAAWPLAKTDKPTRQTAATSYIRVSANWFRRCRARCAWRCRALQLDFSCRSQ